jgi:hypothetical protein
MMVADRGMIRAETMAAPTAADSAGMISGDTMLVGRFNQFERN